MSKRANWCDEHACEYTGFTTMYCPRCEEEVVPVPFVATHLAELKDTIYDFIDRVYGNAALPAWALSPTTIKYAYENWYDQGACWLPPLGWFCTKLGGHDGPCAAVPYDDEQVP